MGIQKVSISLKKIVDQQAITCKNIKIAIVADEINVNQCYQCVLIALRYLHSGVTVLTSCKFTLKICMRLSTEVQKEPVLQEVRNLDVHIMRQMSREARNCGQAILPILLELIRIEHYFKIFSSRSVFNAS